MTTTQRRRRQRDAGNHAISCGQRVAGSAVRNTLNPHECVCVCALSYTNALELEKSEGEIERERERERLYTHSYNTFAVSNRLRRSLSLSLSLSARICVCPQPGAAAQQRASFRFDLCRWMTVCVCGCYYLSERGRQVCDTFIKISRESGWLGSTAERRGHSAKHTQPQRPRSRNDTQAGCAPARHTGSGWRIRPV